ncbi:hypothetical protein GWI33_018278 [Rhynchophorus ferrugineus]|uniref:Uncharacterized protein n=1 Tax=Rhynchophorus ferrugineus TaxID=354439 RepID=A0A834HV81_RHYFE|nr:hypothetical protein GWI33_018278 [Rhynchophorus ferrugineus]
MNGYQIHIHMFDRKLSAISKVPKVISENKLYKGVKNNTGLHGLDPIIIYNLSKDLNFTIITTIGKTKSDFGHVFSNGTANGAIGRVLDGKANMSGNGRFIVYYNSEKFEYSVAYFWDTIVLMVPKSPKLTQWAKIGASSLFKFTAKSYFYPEIKTFKELDKINLPINTHQTDLFNMNADSQVLNNLRRKIIQLGSNMTSMHIAAYLKTVAAVERKYDAMTLIALYYTDQYGVPLLHIVEEFVRSHYLGYIVSKGFPFLPVINNLLTQYSEFGFCKKWKGDFYSSLILEMQYTRTFESSDTITVTLKDLEVPFMVLAAGLVTSIFVFLIELNMKHFH